MENVDHYYMLANDKVAVAAAAVTFYPGSNEQHRLF